MPRVIRREQKKEESKKCEQETEKKLGESLRKDLKELKAERNEIDNKETLESGQTNVQSTSRVLQNTQNRLKVS